MIDRLPELLPPESEVTCGPIVIEPTLANRATEIALMAGFSGKHILIVCDANTHKALAQRVAQELAPLSPETLILEGTPHADRDTVAHIRKQPHDALVAVGSGTINDLCKYASFLDAKPYIVLPTAPSMNGYLSANASITSEGHKKTLAAQMPAGVFCDLGVLAQAPVRLIRSGLGDSLCRPTAQADWLLSHLLLDTPYTDTPYALLAPYEQELFAHSGKLAEGDIGVIELLMRTLLASGLGMSIAGGSYPASQGEHLIAHTMEMKHGGLLAESFHGEQIGVTTLTMAHIQHQLLSAPLKMRTRAHWEKAISSYFGAALTHSVTEASWNKHLLMEHHEALNAKLLEKGDAIQSAIRSVLLPEEHLREVLANAGAPVSAIGLGWSEREYDLAVSHARFIRDRFTFLDLL
jgi:glycerol-1-phosphate dehydrogenase [NAD(P)+]